MSRTRAFPILTAASCLGLLAGCGSLTVAQPEDPEVPPPSKVAAQSGEAAEFLAAYSDRLGDVLGEGGEGLDQIQAGPLLERTEGEIKIAEARGDSLASMPYVDIIPAAPVLEEYPLWFIAVATPETSSDSRQLMLVSRESASEGWKISQSAFVSADAAPVFLGAENGAVQQAEEDFVTGAQQAEEELAGYLAGGEEPGSVALDSTAFQDYLDYQAQLSDPENGFDDVEASCEPYADAPLLERALSTQDGAIAMGEVRCTLTISVAEEFALNLGESVEAVMTGDGTGNTVRVVTSHPFIVSSSGDALTLRATDWYLLEAVTE